MAEYPALTLWTDSYLGDTRHLTTAEHGAYLLLLIEAWRRPSCSLPDDDALLRRLTGMSADDWDASKDTVMAFWKRDGRSRTWSQKRLKKERDKSAMRSKSAADNAAKRWNKTIKDDAAAKRPQSVGNASIDHIPIPNGIGASPAEIDPVKALFDTGVALLTAGGATEKQARGQIAKWRKNHGETWTRDAIASAGDKTDPMGWIERLAKTAASASDDAAALRRATLDLYASMPGPPAHRREQTDA